MEPRDVTERNTESLICCLKCELGNAQSHRFCRQCGSILWRNCPQCGEQRPIDEVFCAACGTDLGSADRELVESYQQQLAEARRMIEHWRLNEAVQTLSKLANQNHPRLERVRTAAQSLISDVTVKRDRCEQQAAVHVERAGILADEHRFKEAQRELDKIPVPMRDQKAQSLAERIAATWEEIEKLKQQLVQPRGVPFSDRMAAISRLLELTPDDPRVKRWARQIHDQAIAAANDRLAAHRYQQGVELLHAIPQGVRSEKLIALQRHAEELEYLESELRFAPTVNPIVLEAGRRLIRIDKGNDHARQALREMTKRHQAASGDSGKASIPWTPCPKQTHVGLPVDPFVLPRCLRFASSESERQFQKHPGQFFVACGLALQAIGQAAVSTDLMPVEKQGIWGLLQSNIREPAAKSGWGLDLSTSGLKAVHLTWDQGGNVEVARCIHVPHRELASANGSVLLESLRKFSSEQLIKATDRVVTQWPTVKSLVRYPTVPRASGGKYRKLIEQEAQYQIPFPLADVCWDSFTFPELEQAGVQHQLLLLAARSRDVQERVELFREAGITVHGIQCDAIALHNLLHFDLFQNSSKSDKTSQADSARTVPRHMGIGTLDVGHDATGVIFSFPDFVWFRAFRPASDDLVAAISQRFKTTREVAERVVRDPTKVKRMSDVNSELCVQFRKIVGQFESAVSELKKVAGQKKIDRLLIGGGAARTHGLLRFLRFGR